jgi:glycerol uptake facilitator-like aquaporin
MLSEAMGIFILIFLILYVTGPYSFITNNGAKYCFIAVFIYIGRKFAVMSGNQINLALTLSQAFVGFSNCDFMGFKYFIVWVIGDVVGVVFATTLYNYVLEPTLSYMEVHST